MKSKDIFEKLKEEILIINTRLNAKDEFEHFLDYLEEILSNQAQFFYQFQTALLIKSTEVYATKIKDEHYNSKLNLFINIIEEQIELSDDSRFLVGLSQAINYYKDNKKNVS